MIDELLINVRPTETRVALVSEGRLIEIFVERRGNAALLGNLYLGRIARLLPALGGAFVELGLERSGFLPDVAGGSEAEAPLEEGAPVMVQVAKDATGDKGVRLTSRLNLPGRYLVLGPGAGSVRVSRKIVEDAERLRLTELVAPLMNDGESVVLRTAAGGVCLTELEAELHFLRDQWAEIEAKRKEASPPACLYSEPDAILRVLRDDCPATIERVLIDSEEAYARAQDFCRRRVPELVSKLVPFNEPSSIFELHDVETALIHALRPQVTLDSGGSLIIENTEALTAIDVDSGRYVKGQDVEETSYRTNLAAAGAIARELRLRSIGGLIVVDFISMERPEHREEVLTELRESLEQDRLPTSVGEMSPLGLVEVTRKRTRPSLAESLTEPCAVCAGTARQPRLETVAGEILESAAREVRAGARALEVVAAPEVAAWLEAHGLGEEAVGTKLESLVGCPLNVRAEASYERDRFEIVAL